MHAWPHGLNTFLQAAVHVWLVHVVVRFAMLETQHCLLLPHFSPAGRHLGSAATRPAPSRPSKPPAALPTRVLTMTRRELAVARVRVRASKRSWSTGYPLCAPREARSGGAAEPSG